MRSTQSVLRSGGERASSICRRYRKCPAGLSERSWPLAASSFFSSLSFPSPSDSGAALQPIAHLKTRAPRPQPQFLLRRVLKTKGKEIPGRRPALARPTRHGQKREPQVRYRFMKKPTPIPILSQRSKMERAFGVSTRTRSVGRKIPGNTRPLSTRRTVKPLWALSVRIPRVRKKEQTNAKSIQQHLRTSTGY